MAHTLPDLAYTHEALEPYIDRKTMQIHHGKHHQGYINNLNAALEGYDDLQSLPVETLLSQIDNVPEAIKIAVRNNGGGHANHSLFWAVMSPAGGGQPKGALAEAITNSFRSFEAFQAAFNNAATTRFGSGWAWLVLGGDGYLQVYSTANQDSPYMKSETPILALDVWEHAYYLKYQNRRPEYVGNFWNVVNWDQVGRNFEEAVR